MPFILWIGRYKNIKEKFIEAIKKIDFEKLSVNELKTVSEITETIDKLSKKDYMETLVETLKSGKGDSETNVSKSISELK
uniref:Uncharacterized protein n=1 Tax=Siphoviridae sp. ct7EW56 TaxID=2827562 RepID=A0A8S5LSA0_9CAUD|nr:MAG TPA: hypothetical protein [Siphoviridae sp. ct7EW56]